MTVIHGRRLFRVNLMTVLCQFRQRRRSMANYTAASCGCRVVALSASQLWQKYSPLPCRCRRAKRPLNGDLDLPRFEGQWQPSSARTSRQPAMASRMFDNASSRVWPWLTQPGIEGHSATQTPSSSRSSVVTNFIELILIALIVFGKPDESRSGSSLPTFPTLPQFRRVARGHRRQSARVQS